MTLWLALAACVVVPTGSTTPTADSDTGVVATSLTFRNALAHRSPTYLGLDPTRGPEDGRVEVFVDGTSAGVFHYRDELTVGSSPGLHDVEIQDADSGAPLASSSFDFGGDTTYAMLLCPPLLSVWNRGRQAFDLTVDHLANSTDTHTLSLPINELPFGVDVGAGTVRARTWVSGQLAADHQGQTKINEALLCSTRVATVDFSTGGSSTDPTVCSVINRDEDCHGELGLYNSQLVVP